MDLDLNEINPPKLERWMDEVGLTPGVLKVTGKLTGGTQNIMIEIEKGDTAYVLRRPGLRESSNRDETIRREIAVLTALASTPVPHPEVLAWCLDPTVLGAAFYLMEKIDGFNVSLGIPEPQRSAADMRRAMAYSVIDTLGALSKVDPSTVRLDRFGRVDGYVERQVPRWRRQFEAYSELAGYDPSELAGTEVLGDWLERNQPASYVPSLIHGDFHLANLLFDPVEPCVSAVVDWELATTGDALVDLGLLLATWPEPSNPAAGVLNIDQMAFPPSSELIDRYADRCPRDLGDLKWYEVLACYRMAIIIEGSYARACAGVGDAEVGMLLHTNARLLLERARTRVSC
ncbi:MAG: phosphotransferase family protein [Acidimicrobiales bacterium]